MQCPNCTIAIPDGSKFCLNCGSNLSGLSGEEPAVIAPQPGAVHGEGKPADSPGQQDPTPWLASIGDRKTIGAALDPAAVRIPAALPQVPLAERYEVLSEVGRGGFGIVYQARDKKLDRTVAVKRLLENQLSGTQRTITLERFEREARAIAGLNHRHIVQVFDHDQDSEGHYIVMEYVSGGTLAAYLRKQKRLPVDEALDLVKGICQGLGFAHRRNLVHRDIKPANILLSDEEGRLVAKIVDFGLARQGGGSEVSISGYGLGTPWYMPPEQRRDAKNVNHTADIYALGKTLYELVTGEIPDNVDPELIPPPPVLARVILKCLKSNPEDRYFSMEELLADLERVQSGVSTAAPAAMPAGQALAKNVCPTCNTANGDDVKFCEQCGTGLYRSCPECDRENSIHKKFCGSCGTEVEGFVLVSGILQKIEQYRQEKRWSRVLKEADQVPPKVQLPKAKGQQKLQAIGKLQDEARQMIAKCDETQKVIDEACETQEYEKALELISHFREIDPHDAAINALLDRLPQDIARQKDEQSWEAALADAGRLAQDDHFDQATEVLRQYISRFPSGQFVGPAQEELRRVRQAELKSVIRHTIVLENGPRLRELIDQYRHELESDDEIEKWSSSLPEWEDDWAWKAAVSRAANSEEIGALAAAAEELRTFLTDHEESRHADEARSEWERLVRMELHHRLDAAVGAHDAWRVEQVVADARRLVGADGKIESAAQSLPEFVIEWDWQATVSESEQLINDNSREAAAARYLRHVEFHPGSSHAAEARQCAIKLQRDSVRLRLNAAIQARDADGAARLIEEWRKRFGVTEDIEQFAASLPERKDDWDWERARRAVANQERAAQHAAKKGLSQTEEHDWFGSALEIVEEYCSTHPQSSHLDSASQEIARIRQAQLVVQLRSALDKCQFAQAFRLSEECGQFQIEAPELDLARRHIPKRIVDEILQLSAPRAQELVDWYRQRFGDKTPPGAAAGQSVVDDSTYQAIRQSVEQYLKTGKDAVLFAETFQFAINVLHARILKERLDEGVRGGAPENRLRDLLSRFSGRRLDFPKPGRGAAYFDGIHAWTCGPGEAVAFFVARAQEDRADFRREVKEATSILYLNPSRGPQSAAEHFKTYLNQNAFGAYVVEAQTLLQLLEGKSESGELAALLAESDKAVREARLYLRAFCLCNVRDCPRRAQEHLQMARQIRDAHSKSSRQYQSIDLAIRKVAGDVAADIVDKRLADRSEFRAAVEAAAEKVFASNSRAAADQIASYLTRFPQGRYAAEARDYILAHGGKLPVKEPPPPPKPVPPKSAKPEQSSDDEFILSLEDDPAESSDFELTLEEPIDIFETDFEIPALEDDEFELELVRFESVKACKVEIYIELADSCQKNRQLARAREHLASAESLLKEFPAHSYDRGVLIKEFDEVKRKVQ